jgi:hypothetical protein
VFASEAKAGVRIVRTHICGVSIVGLGARCCLGVAPFEMSRVIVGDVGWIWWANHGCPVAGVVIRSGRIAEGGA